MPKVKQISGWRILRPNGGSFLETNEQVVHGKPAKSVQSLKKQALKVKMRDLVVSPLIDYATRVNSPNLQGYWAAYKCCKVLVQSQNTYLTPEHRCGHRLCGICNNIRTAKLLDRLFPLVDQRKKWGLLVLTRSNKDLRGADSQKLKEVIDREFYKNLSKIRQRVKRKFGEVDSIISFEVEPEQYKKQKKGGIYYGYFNPHFNIFGEVEVLEFIRKEWMKLVDCTLINQDLKPIKDGDVKVKLLEVLKYATKGVTKFDKYLNVKAVDTIISALKGRRRIITWGVFYQKNIEKIETDDIESLDLVKQPYNDIPIKDYGDYMDMVNAEGGVVCSVPSYVKDIRWGFNDKTCNYEYVDEFGKIHDLLKWKEPPREFDIKLFVDLQPFNKWKYGNEEV